MRRLETLILSILLLAFVSTLSARENRKDRYTFLLTGASFASPNNGWFEVGCELTGATPLNRAIGGEAIADAANRMAEGTLYSKEELEEIDALVIKRYLTECYNLKFNKNSKYYNTRSGKPAVIVLCTDWHDGRVTYNTSVRKLAEKWGFPVVEFDKYIGFSRNSVHPVTGEQISLLFTGDQQQIAGEKFGWHPENGQDNYIQRRMGAIFADTMRKIFPI